MLFWTKKKKIVVDAFTDNENIAKYPISPTTKNLPEWYKKLKPNHRINDDGHELLVSTFKRCDGMIDLISNTFTFPMWADLNIIVDDKGFFSWKYPASPYNMGMEQHPSYQIQGAFDPLVHAKIMSPWFLREKTGVQFYQTQAFYSFNEFGGNVLIPPGVVNFKHQVGTNINTFLHRQRQYFFNAGQPMMYLIPMTENEVEIKTHVISQQEWIKIGKSSAPNKFMDAYKNRKKLTCPVTGK